MITKAYSQINNYVNYLKQKFTKKQGHSQPLRVIPIGQYKRGINHIQKIMPKYQFNLVANNENQTKNNVNFELSLKGDQQLKNFITKNGDNSQKVEQIIDEVRQLSQQFARLQILEDRISKIKDESPVIKAEIHKEDVKDHNLIVSQRQLRKQYKFEVVQFLQLKYEEQKSEYPLISFEDYKKITTFWKQKRRAGDIKKTKYESAEKLTYKAMGGIDHFQWLNDEIVNIYMQLMQKNLIKQQEIKLVNSFFAVTTLTKTQNMIQRALKKKNIEKDHTIIMPINQKNHWYFAKFQDKTLIVYDSLSKKLQYYMENTIFKNAIKFGKNFYGIQLQLSVCPTYPQQNNGHDCGVFMLMGIRDILRQKQWSYLQGDIKFKRIQIACQVFHGAIFFNP